MKEQPSLHGTFNIGAVSLQAATSAKALQKQEEAWRVPIGASGQWKTQPGAIRTIQEDPARSRTALPPDGFPTRVSLPFNWWFECAGVQIPKPPIQTAN